jgi:hypothetical protein
MTKIEMVRIRMRKAHGAYRVGEIVELRGRTAPTQLARPVSLAVRGELTELSG